MKLNSLAFRLFATSAAWTLIVLPLAGYMIYSLYKEDVQTGFDTQLKKLLTALAVDSMNTDGTVPVSPVNRYEPLFEVTHSGWYWQIKPLDSPQAPRLVSPSLATATLPSPYDRKFPTDTTGTRWMNVAGPTGETIRILEVIDSPGHDPAKPQYSVIVAGPLDWLESIVGTFRARLSVALTLVGLGLVALTLFQVRFGLLPLRRIEKGLAAVRSGEASELTGQLPAEIEPLQVELNELIRSNQEIVERARTQVGNLAHALKTPLAVITNETSDVKSPFGEKVAEQSALMRDQISHYLDRARVAANARVIGRVTPLAETVAPLVRALERIHRDKGVSITVDCPATLKFRGEKQDLEEMLGNLMDNACKWCAGTVYLTASLRDVTSRARGAKLLLTVEDNGPGLSEEQRQLIGRRGTRLDESKPGSGLGLSIVKDIAQSYRGTFSLGQSEHGGLLVRLELPAA